MATNIILYPELTVCSIYSPNFNAPTSTVGVIQYHHLKFASTKKKDKIKRSVINLRSLLLKRGQMFTLKDV